MPYQGTFHARCSSFESNAEVFKMGKNQKAQKKMVIHPTSPIDVSATYSSEASIDRQVFWSIFLIYEIQRFHHPCTSEFHSTA